MIRKWFGIVVLIAVAAAMLNMASCADPQELVSITIQPATETIGSSNIPVSQDAGIQVQMRALGTYIHPPVTKDITDQVTWASNTPQLVTINSTGLMVATGILCGGGLVSATSTTNADASGLSSSGAVVTGYATVTVTCFTGSTSGGGSSEPVLTVNFMGNGQGVVSSQTSGFTCASTAITCVDSFQSGTTITLSATPVSPATFGGWSGACTGTSTCALLLQNNTTVTATFN